MNTFFYEGGVDSFLDVPEYPEEYTKPRIIHVLPNAGEDPMSPYFRIRRGRGLMYQMLLPSTATPNVEDNRVRWDKFSLFKNKEGIPLLLNLQDDGFSSERILETCTIN